MHRTLTGSRARIVACTFAALCALLQIASIFKKLGVGSRLELARALAGDPSGRTPG